MAIRVVSVSAPENYEGFIGCNVLSSDDPVSLFNACRYAALLADNGVGFWGDSNWNCGRKEKRESFLLMHSLEKDMIRFEDLINKFRPNLILMGAMSLCLPGAIACAKKARELLGDRVFIVLGGRHVSESIYLDKRGSAVNHISSPLSIVENGEIDEGLFDLFVSGEGEFIIAEIGNIIGKMDELNIPFSGFSKYLDNIDKAPGKWLIGLLDENGESKFIKSKNKYFDRDSLPSAIETFGVSSGFDIFPKSKTAHIFNDSGGGCLFDCSFCSERRSVTGISYQRETSAERLFRQLESTVRIVKEDYGSEFSASAFIEDSTVLNGSNNSLKKLIKMLEASELEISFGGQFTVDQVIAKKDILRDFKSVGFDYVFVGVETLEPEAVGGINKDRKSDYYTWEEKIKTMLGILNDLGIKCGISLLFGLGESHNSRVVLLNKVKSWIVDYGLPSVVSMNWAVQHPLKGNDSGTNYKYIEWGSPTSSWVEAFSIFGEASYLYPIFGQKRPVLEEVKEVASMYCDLFRE